MVNKDDLVIDDSQNYSVIAALVSTIYLLPIGDKKESCNEQQHTMTDIRQRYRKIEYVMNDKKET